MEKSEAEIQEELLKAKKELERESNSRKLGYAQVEYDMMMQEKKREAIARFYYVVQKYGIASDDILVLLDTVPYI